MILDQTTDKSIPMERYLAACQAISSTEKKIQSLPLPKKQTSPPEHVPFQDELFLSRIPNDLTSAIDNHTADDIGQENVGQEDVKEENSSGNALDNIKSKEVADEGEFPSPQRKVNIFDCNDIIDKIPIASMEMDNEGSVGLLHALDAISPEEARPAPIKEIDPQNIVVPDHFTPSEIEAKYSDRLNGERPFVEVDFFGLGYRLHMLLDSGASLSVLNLVHFTKIEELLHDQGLSIARVPVEMCISNYGGQVLSNHGGFLCHMAIGPGGINVVKNVPMVIISSDTATRNTGVLGMNLIRMLNMSLDFKKDHCLLTFGPQTTLTGFKAILKGRLSHRLAVAESIELQPKQTSKVEFVFESSPDVPNNLDGLPLHMKNEDGFAESDLEQVVHSKEGRVMAIVANRNNHTLLLHKNVTYATVNSINDYYESYYDLSSLDGYINAVNLSPLERITCLCSNETKYDGLLLVVQRSGFTNFGTPWEPRSVFEESHMHRKNKTVTPRLKVRGPHCFLYPNSRGKHELLHDTDLEIIQRKFPLTQGDHLAIPALNYKFVDQGVIDTAVALRNLGYKVSLCPLLLDCDYCCNFNPNRILPIESSYKMKTVSIIFPSKYSRVPPEYARKLKGTEVYLWRVWDLHLFCYLQANRLVIVAHVTPPHLSSNQKVVAYLSTIFSQLKPLYPNSTIELLTQSMEDDKFLWVEGANQAWNLAKYFPSFTDTSLSKSRKRPDSKLNYEDVDIKSGQCSCLFCASPKIEVAPAESLGILYAIDSPWPLADDLKNRLNELERLNRQQNNRILEHVNSIEIGAGHIPLHDLDSISEVCEIADISMDSGNMNMDVEGNGEICGIEDSDSQVVFLKEEPRASDELADYYIPPNKPAPKMENYFDLFKTDHLGPSQKQMLSDLVNRFPQLWAVDAAQTRWITKNVIDFTVSSDEGFYCKPYPLPPNLKAIFNALFDRLIDRGMVVDAANEIQRPIMWSASFLVPRSSDLRNKERVGIESYRIVHSFVRLNSLIVTPDEGYRIPCAADCFQNFSRVNSKSTLLDVHSYFNSHLLSGRSRKYVGLSGYDAKGYQGCGVLLGLNIAPGQTSMLKSYCIRPELAPLVENFVDDIAYTSFPEDATDRHHLVIPNKYAELIGTAEDLDYDWINHFVGLELLFEDLDKYQLLLAPAKALIYPTEGFLYLGWWVKENKISIPEGRMEFFSTFDPRKCTSKLLSSFLGALQYIGNSIEGLSSKTAILYHKLNMNLPPKQFFLSDLEVALCEELKCNVLANPIRHIFSYERPTFVFCDSSGVSCASVIFQEIDSRLVFVEAISHKYNNVDLRALNSLEKEMASIWFLLHRKGDIFLGKHKVTIFSDMYLCCWLINNPDRISGQTRLARWLMAIVNSHLQFRVQWISNKDKFLKITDSYSRNEKVSYATRFSNRLQGENLNKVPYFEEGATVTTAQLMQYVLDSDMVSFPKTFKDHTWEQFKSSDPFLDKTSIEHIVEKEILPRISYGVTKESIPEKSYDYPCDTADVDVGGEVEELDVAHVEELELVPLGGHRQVVELAMLSLDALNVNIDMFKEIRDRVIGDSLPYTRDSLAEGQRRDSRLQKIILSLTSKTPSKSYVDNYAMINLILCRRTTKGLKVVLPFELLLVVVSHLHLHGHLGWSSLQRMTSTHFWSKSITAVCRAVTAVCKVCLFCRPWPAAADHERGITWRSSTPFFTVHADIIVMTEAKHHGETYSAVLNIVDNCTKLCLATRTLRTDGEAIALILENVFASLPKVHFLFTDNASNLSISAKVTQLLKRFNVEGIRPLSRSKHSAGFIERQNLIYRTLSKVHMFAMKTKNWCEVHSLVVRSMNELPRRHFRLDNEKVSQFYASPIMMAFSEDSSQTMDSIWNHPDLSAAERKSWRNDTFEAIRRYDLSQREKQEEEDAKAREKYKIGPDQIVLLRKFSRLQKQEITYYVRNLYRVISRKDRSITITSVYGDPPQVLTVNVDHVRPVTDTRILDLLPDNLKLLLGYNLPLEEGGELPFELRSELPKENKERKQKRVPVAPQQDLDEGEAEGGSESGDSVVSAIQENDSDHDSVSLIIGEHDDFGRVSDLDSDEADGEDNAPAAPAAPAAQGPVQRQLLIPRAQSRIRKFPRWLRKRKK